MDYVTLKKFFKEKGYTQEDIALKLGVSEQYVNAILNGRKELGKKQAERLSNLYGLSYSWLLTGEGSMTINNNGTKPYEQSNRFFSSSAGETKEYLSPSKDWEKERSAYLNLIERQKREIEEKDKEIHNILEKIVTSPENIRFIIDTINKELDKSDSESLNKWRTLDDVTKAVIVSSIVSKK